MKLHTAMIFAKDLPRMLAFYRDGVGLTVRDAADPGYVVLDAGGASLALHAIPPAIAAHIDITSPPAARGDTALKLIFASDDVAAARVHLQAHGAVLRAPAADGSFDALDPEGNVLRVTRAHE